MDRSFAQVVNLTPPPTHRQFATERVRARNKERTARKKLHDALAEGDKQGRARVNPAEVTRIWGSLAFRDLRDILTEPEQEKLRAHLAAYMAGETTPAVWHATVNAVAALRRATDSVVGARRR
jgi:hypothetical protein